MAAVTLKAHYDGERIQLDEPFDIPLNSPLMVTVLTSPDGERFGDWQGAAQAGLARAYGNGGEPDYTAADVKR
jgi:hypothetical protein